MQTKVIEVSLDGQLIDKAGIILDDIGIDVQSVFSICLKRIIKEGNINFLLKTSSLAVGEAKNTGETKAEKQEDFNFDYGRNSYKNNGEITEEMRDYAWKAFVSHKYLTSTEYQELARKAAKDTGMNQGSAYIYFIILSSLIEGKPNTRTMKFADLVYYIKKILKECPENEFAATLRSLEKSIPYWRDHIPGKFGDKVQRLVDQYKTFL